MKKLTFWKSLFLLCALIVGSSSAWGQVASAVPTDGGSYVIAAYVNSKYYALPNGALTSGTPAGVEVELNSLNKVSTTDAAGLTWTLEEGSGANEDKYYFKYTTSDNKTYYLYKNGTNTSNYKFAINMTSKNYWSFTSNGTGYTITAVDRGSNHLNIQYNSGAFRCNNTATSIILLEVGDAPTADLDHITISGTYPTSFYQGDAFSHEGMTVTATYGTGDGATTADVTNSATFTGYDMSTIGEQTVTVSYTEGTGEGAITKTATYDITVNALPTPTSITLTGTYPNTFIVDDDFSHEGMTVTATFDDSSSRDVTADATFTGYDMSATGEQTVTVTYTSNNVSVTQTYNITVNPIPTKTIAQFIAAGGGKCYLVGTISNDAKNKYGNYDLTDDSGTIYVYGTLTSAGVSQQYLTLGIGNGDMIKVLADEYVYFNNTTHEAKNVRFIEKIVPNAHTLTVSATNGSVEITGKTLTNNACEVAENTSVTATATPAEHYTFTSWSATGVTLADATANPLTFTMPTNDVTLTANFTEMAKHTATFYVQGVAAGSDANVYEGDAITFPTNIAVPTGYTLMGWTTAAIAGEQNTAPATLVTAANMGNADVSYYAVFAIGSVTGSDTYEKLSSNSFDTNVNYVIGAKGAGDDNTIYYLYSYNNKVDENANWGLVSSDVENDTPIQFKLSGTSDALVAKDNSNNYLKGLTTGNFYMSSTSTAVALNTDGSIKNSSSGSYYLRYNTSGGLRWYSSNTGQKAYFYKVIPGVSYASYCTTVPETGTITLNAACHDSNGTIYGTFYTNRAYVMPENMVGQVVRVDNHDKLAVDDAYEEGDVVPANTALLLYTIDDFTGTKDYTITYSTGGVDFSEYNMLKGTLTASETTTGDNCLFYRLTMHNGTTIGFYWGAENGAAFTPGANKAYLAVPTAQAAKMSGFAFDDTTTGINGVEEIAPVTKTRKVVKNGRLVIETANGEFTIDGARMK